MAFEPRGSVFRITNKADQKKFGTGFVIHIDKSLPGKSVAYLLTCAHVVDDLGQDSMTVEGSDAQFVAIGETNSLDLAIIKVDFPPGSVRQVILTTGEAQQDPVEMHGFRDEKRVCLKAKFNKHVDLPLTLSSELRFSQFVLVPDQGIEPEPDEIKKGYSGSPVVLAGKGGKTFAVLNTRRTTVDGKHKVGAAIPVWHLVKILPESLDQVGEQLFGADYWRILRQVSAQTGEITLNEYERAFRACCANPDRYPAEYSLWGCAVTLREFESDSDPSRLLSRFLTALGIPGYAEKPAAGPGVAPASGGNSIHVPPTQVYRQLIIRVVRRLASRRDDAGGKGGDRYWLEVHTAELDACPQACCDRGGKECAPYTARALPTIYARRTEEERRTGLKELLQEEIQDILAAFGSHIPDLIQFVAPEELLAGLIVTDQIDQVRVRDGREPLAEWRPTIFSGARLSNAADAGRDLIERLNSDSPLQGGVINLNSAELTRQVRGQLKEAIVAVLSTPEAVRALLPDAPFFVPFVLVSAEKADAVVAKVTGLHCKRRIAQEMHAQQYDSSLPERLPIIINTPNIEIRFAEAEEPVIVGN